MLPVDALKEDVFSVMFCNLLRWLQNWSGTEMKATMVAGRNYARADRLGCPHKGYPKAPERDYLLVGLPTISLKRAALVMRSPSLTYLDGDAFFVYFQSSPTTSNTIPTASSPTKSAEKLLVASRIALMANMMHPIIRNLSFILFVFSTP